MFLALLLFCLGWARPVLAAGESAKLKADEVTLLYEVRRLIAVGHAHLTYQDLTIDADRIEIDLDQNVLTAAGRVVLAEADRLLNAEELSYDLNTKSGRLGAFRAEVNDPSAKGTIYLSGEALLREEEKIEADELSLTTCGLEEAHYHFTAGQVEYFPGDRLILRRVFYFEGHLKLLYLPYLAINLKERSNSFQFPRLGYNAAEGLYLKLAYNFYAGDDQEGVLLLDLMQRKGIGEGVQYHWRLSEAADLNALVYHLDNLLTEGDDYRLQAGLTLDLARSKVQSTLVYLDQSMAGGDRTQTYQLGMQLSPVQQPGLSGTLNYSLTDAPGREREQFNLALSSSWQPWNQATLRLYGQWGFTFDEWAAVPFASRENYEASLTQNWQGGRFTALLRNVASPGLRLTLLPELTLNLPALDAGPWLGHYALNLDYQHREVVSTTLTGEGDRLALNLDRERLRLAALGPLTLEAGIGAKGRLYDTGESIAAVTPYLTLGAKVSPAFRVEGGLHWTAVEGAAPPLFASEDNLLPGGSLSLRGVYLQGAWQANVSTGYLLSARSWQPLYLNVNWSSSKGDRLSLATSYDWVTGTIGSTNLTLDWRPLTDWSVKVYASYDPLIDGWSRLAAAIVLKQPLTANLSLGLNAQYDLFNAAWYQSAISLGYNWHCRTLSVGYDWIRGEVNLTLAINAFPQYPVKFGLSESGFIFTPPVIIP